MMRKQRALAVTLVFLVYAGLLPLFGAKKSAQATMNKLLPGEKLLPGQSLKSSNGQFTLIFQTDGNVVLYPTNQIDAAHALWNTETVGKSARVLIMQPDGNLVLYNSASDLSPQNAIWNTATVGNPGSGLVLQDDGNLVIYKSNSQCLWTRHANKRVQDGNTLVGTGPYNGPVGFSRNMQTTRYCGNSPESWVRGSANIDQNTGVVSITVQLETDSNKEGPKGVVKVTALDGCNNIVGTATSGEVEIGGKPPGNAVIQNFHAKAALPKEFAQRAYSLSVDAQCTGSKFGPWGLPWPPVTIEDAFKIAVAILGSPD